MARTQPAHEHSYVRNGRKAVLPEFAGVVVIAFAIYLAMRWLEPSLAKHSAIISTDSLIDAAAHSYIYRGLWLIVNTTEAQFYASVGGGVGLILFATCAHYWSKSRRKFAGFAICADTGLFPWILLSSTLGLVFASLLFGNNLSNGWAPTFVPFVSIPAGIVLIYGKGLKNALMGAALGGTLPFPIAYFMIQSVLTPNNLPAIIGNVTGMWLGGIIAFEVCRRVPWMSVRTNDDTPPLAPESDDGSIDAYQAASDSPATRRGWFTRRVLADFSEAQFYGNEWASAGLLAGTILTWILNPGGVFYGNGWLPALLLGQFLTSALGILIYYDQWRELGWYGTFVPIVSVVPGAIVIFGGDIWVVLIAAVLGALIGPPVTQWISQLLPSRMHPFIAATFSMALTTTIVIAFLAYLPGVHFLHAA